MTGPFPLAGQVAVVTGSASGLGLAVADAFGQQGAALALADIHGAEQIAMELSQRHGVAAVGAAVDVSKKSEVDDFLSNVVGRLGAPTTMVTMAGGSLGTSKDLDTMASDDVDLVIDVNLKGTLYSAVAAARLMESGGTIVTVSSIGGRQPSPVSGVPYAASKAGVLGLTRRLAQVYGSRGIRVNCVAPGLFLTDRLQGIFDAMAESERRQVLDAIPLGRLPDIKEIINPILFLAGPDSSYITGATLDINGGRFMP